MKEHEEVLNHRPEDGRYYFAGRRYVPLTPELMKTIEIIEERYTGPTPEDKNEV